MFENLYFEELKNDVIFLDRLAQCRESYRVFGPFLQNKYEDLFYPDFDEYRAGIYDYDIWKICHKAGIFTPLYVPCIISRNHNVEDYKNGPVRNRVGFDFTSDVSLRKYCIGIGHYETRDEGEFHMCVLIDLYDGMIAGISFSEEFSASITEKAILLAHDLSGPNDIIVHSSQNKVYQTQVYREICDIYGVVMSMTTPGTHGGVMPVSQFFSNLKRKKAAYEFTDVQDGIDWLASYVLQYNVERYLVREPYSSRQ